jgi:8-oxo-dGTP diphosphatase
MPAGDRKLYVVGFAFTRDSKSVALIRKERPDWQRGRFNGIGGKIEPGESPSAAMVREFREEAGVLIPEWDHFLTLEYPQATVHFFRSFGFADQVKTLTDETVFLCNVSSPPHGLIDNLRWLLPMAALEDFPKRPQTLRIL